MNIQNQESEYKGKFHRQSVVKNYYEGGAHFKASDLFMHLIELQKEKYLLNDSLQTIQANQENNKHRKIPSMFNQKKDKITLHIRDISSEDIRNDFKKNIQLKKTDLIVLRHKTELSILDKQIKSKHRHVISIDSLNRKNNNNEFHYILTDINSKTKHQNQIISKSKRNINIKTGKKILLLPNSINTIIPSKTKKVKLPQILKNVTNNLSRHNDKSSYYI